MSTNRFKIPYLPEDLSGLADVALNFSWRWNRFARELFRELDPVLWHLSGRNPIDLLRRLDPARLQACARDPAFMALYEKVRAAASTERYSSDTWFSGTFPEMAGKKVVLRPLARSWRRRPPHSTVSRSRPQPSSMGQRTVTDSP